MLDSTSRSRALGPIAIAVLLGAARSVPAADGEWPGYLGPKRNGVSTEKSWKSEWKEGGPQELWRKDLGTGSACVSLRDGRLYTSGNGGDKDTVYCLDAATGKEVWTFSYPCPLDKRSFEGGTAATPVLDGKLVYVVSHQGHIVALDAEKGTEVWKKRIVEDLGGQRPQWGFAGSPLVEGKLLIVDAGGKGASTVALDKVTGERRWAAGNDIAGYASPVAADIDGKRTVVIFKGKVLVGISPKDGKELFRYKWETSYDVNAATPLISGNRIFICSGYGRGCSLLEVRAGKATKVWETKNMRNHVNSCAPQGDFVYGFDGNVGGGKLTCLSLKDGSAAWRVEGMGTGSVHIAGGRLIALGEDGDLKIGPADPKGFRPTFEGKPIEGRCWVAPVLCGGRLYLRNNKGTLICLDMK